MVVCHVAYLAWALPLLIACISGQSTKIKPIHLAIHLKHDDLSFAQAFAKKHSLKLLRKVGDLSGHYLFDVKDNPEHKVSRRLLENEHVLWHGWQFAKKRSKRDTSTLLQWKDPLFSKQWYLTGQAAGDNGLRVRQAWQLGYTGKGVVVSILDDGVQGDHPDLLLNYDASASTDINGNDHDPTPTNNGNNRHGTRCAGQVSSEAGNNYCGVGIAYNASVGGIRILDGPISDSVEAAGLAHNQQHVHIYSSSWGPDDDGYTVDGPGYLVRRVFASATELGRSKLGSIFVWASGNGGSLGDMCSCDGYSNSIYTLSVAAVSQNNSQPWYSEQCASIAAVTYSSHLSNMPAVITTDAPYGCTETHSGTSASAPNAAAIVALALEANPKLTWRDVQHLVIRTSDPSPLLHNDGWSDNAVGRKVSNKFGYGIMDAEALVQAAAQWQTVGKSKQCEVIYGRQDDRTGYGLAGVQTLQGTHFYTLSVLVDECACADVNYVEHVHVVLSVHYSRRGDLRLVIVSPAGTRAELLNTRPRDVRQGSFKRWQFLSLHHWGEQARGNWTLQIYNTGVPENYGQMSYWSMVLYGTAEPAQAGDPAHKMSSTNKRSDCKQPRLGYLSTSNNFALVGVYLFLGVMSVLLLFWLLHCAYTKCRKRARNKVTDSTPRPVSSVSVSVTDSSAASDSTGNLDEQQKPNRPTSVTFSNETGCSDQAHVKIHAFDDS